MDNQKTILLSVEHLRKIYNSRFGSNQVEALKNISFSVDQGEFIAVMGESGSGKTTLLNLLAALDRPTEGKILLAGLQSKTRRSLLHYPEAIYLFSFLKWVLL